MFNLTQLHKLIFDKQALLNFLKEKKLILSEKLCEVCGEDCKLEYRESGKLLWRHRTNSRNGAHNFSESALKNTVFEKSKLSIDKLLNFFYFFAHGITEYDHLIRETSTPEVTTSMNTISQWLVYCREICFITIDDNMTAEDKIGGPGTVVEIDETKIGRRKYNRGRLVEGQWIIGMIELEVGPNTTRRGGRYRIELCPDNQRNADTLIPLIEKHVHPGTTIMSDCWRAYMHLEDHGYNHLTVNHTYNFIDPDTYANTQTIESSWRSLKRQLSRGGIRSENLDQHLWEYLWRREMKCQGKDLFLEFISACATVYNPRILILYKLKF